MTWFSIGGTAFSFYNLTRFGVLSPSGKAAASLGFLFFSMLTFSSIADSRLLRRASHDQPQ
jgi:hypothetical protein